MRVLLVGSAADRVRIRSQLDDSIEVIAEFPTLEAARAAVDEADAILLPSSGSGEPRAGSRVPSTRSEKLELVAVEPLTAREIEVLELLAEGLPNKAIARRLGISDQTVKFHVASLSGKLGATNRTDAVRRAVRRGLIAL
jgi:DNA-binding CsgD family transcriptional regulator